MDIITMIIFASIILSTLLMIVGPLMEMRGKILFEYSKYPPRTKGRIGMGVLTIGAILFLGGCVSRQWFPASVATPIVFSGFVLWFAGGFIAVYRNEVIKALADKSERR